MFSCAFFVSIINWVTLCKVGQCTLKCCRYILKLGTFPQHVVSPEHGETSQKKYELSIEKVEWEFKCA